MMDWISPVDRARLGNNNDVMTRLDSLETDVARKEIVNVSSADSAEITPDLGMVRSGSIYFGDGDPYDLTTLPHGMLTEALGIHIYNQTEIARFGDLNGFLTYVTSTYGIGIGNANAYLLYDPVNGLRIKGTIQALSSVPNGFDVWDEHATGTPNGILTSFSTSNQYAAGTLQVIRNGLWLKETTDYTESILNQITMSIAPTTGDILRVNYVDTNGNSVYNETPGGVINGVNTAFTTASNHISGSVEVYLNGLTLSLNLDYTDATRTFTMVSAPPTGDQLYTAYLVNANTQFVFQETPTGLVNGVNTVYTLANNYQAGTPLVILNGVKQALTLDYTESAVNQITFVTPPQTGDLLWVTYLKQ